MALTLELPPDLGNAIDVEVFLEHPLNLYRKHVIPLARADDLVGSALLAVCA